MKTNKKHRTGIKIYAVIAMSLLVLLTVRLTYVAVFAPMNLMQQQQCSMREKGRLKHRAGA